MIPGGGTRYIQAPDVSWNKPFKQHCTDYYDEWLASKGLYEETECGNLKAPPRKDVIEWILAAWGKLTKEMIKESFVYCAVTCATDGSQDEEITCFKSDNPCSDGLKMLKEQMGYMNAAVSNPFVADAEDVTEACPNELLIEEDEEGDEDVDIL